MTGVPAAVIDGLGAWLPPSVVTNDDLAAYLDTSDQWIRERTGIRERRRVSPGMSTGDLATEAGRLALKASGESVVDIVILATTTPDRRCPGTAPEVASRLGLTGVAALDVSAVCTGFLYGLATAAGLIAGGTAERVLLIGAESFSTIIDPNDRVTAAIFGDGAGAMVLRKGDRDEAGAIGPVVLGSDGEQSDLIMIPAGGARQRSSGTPAGPTDHYFRMNGPDTYRHAVERTTAVARAALDRAGWRVDDVDRFVAHQANARIIGSVADRLGLASDRRLSNIARVGNTAAASVPILLAESAASGALEAGHRTLLAAFGGGLTWGASTVVWPVTTSLVTTNEPAK
ncbi:MAG TPA: beta-ketoacyl-ACP synthase III [Pseudonocardiaceae bacterium]|jgi:3-oxoacyl-[acyl-carrier-protein] synthase-3|nr:beta-ketoacyl-ACP synthase III [Pseudonocardiaceae bacterium]